jgi:hypothetical protein
LPSSSFLNYKYIPLIGFTETTMSSDQIVNVSKSNGLSLRDTFAPVIEALAFFGVFDRSKKEAT